MLSKLSFLTSLALFIINTASAANTRHIIESIKIDEKRSLLLEYKEAYYEKISLKKEGKDISGITMEIPNGRDPSKVGAEKYNKFLFSQPIKNKNSFFIPTLFALRTNSGSTNGQCGSGIEIWLKVIAVQGDLITIKSNELVQSCENDIYLQDNGNGKIEDAFQEDDGRIIVRWLSHPKNNGDSYSQSIQLD